MCTLGDVVTHLSKVRLAIVSIEVEGQGWSGVRIRVGVRVVAWVRGCTPSRGRRIG